MLGYTVTGIVSFLLACKYHMLFDLEVAAVLDNPRCTLWPPFKLLNVLQRLFSRAGGSAAKIFSELVQVRMLADKEQSTREAQWHEAGTPSCRAVAYSALDTT